MSESITITRKGKQTSAGALTGKRYLMTFSQLPGQTFGPFTFKDARSELLLHTGLHPAEIRGLLFDTWSAGQATAAQG